MNGLRLFFVTQIKKAKLMVEEDFETYCMLKQLFTFLSTAQITQIKEKLFEKISNIKRSLLNQNHSFIVETLLFGSNGLNNEDNELVIESTTFKQITTSLEIFMSHTLCIRCV